MKFAFRKMLVYRLVSDSNKKTEEYKRIRDINGAVFPIKAEDLMMSEGNPAEMYKLFANDYSDVKATDKIEYDGEVYIVSKLRKYRGGGLARLEAIIIKPNN